MFKCTIISAGKVSKTYNSMLWIYPKLMIKILQYCNPCFLPGLGIFSLSLCSFAQNRSFYRATMSNLLVIRGNSSQKTINSLDKFAFLVCLWQFSLFFMPKSELLQSLLAHLPFFKESQSLFKKSDCEQFIQVNHDKRATVSDSLRLFRSLMTKEQWERFALFLERIALPLTKNKQIPNPAFYLAAQIFRHLQCAICILLYVYLLPAESEWEILVVFILQIDICLQSRSLPPLPAIHFS